MQEVTLPATDLHQLLNLAARAGALSVVGGELPHPDVVKGIVAALIGKYLAPSAPTQPLPALSGIAADPLCVACPGARVTVAVCPDAPRGEAADYAPDWPAAKARHSR
jgi:hypothetical protein